MMLRRLGMIALLAAMSVPPLLAAQNRPYTEGSVWALTMVRTTAGMSDDYLRGLGTTWKPIIEEAQKQGLVTSYKVLSGNASGVDDWDLLLMVEYKNWAAFDGLADKFEPIQEKIVGGDDEARKLAVQRLEIRRILGEKTTQELILK